MTSLSATADRLTEEAIQWADRASRLLADARGPEPTSDLRRAEVYAAIAQAKAVAAMARRRT